MGRAARHLEGQALLYADVMTDSMRRAIEETTRRRTLQRAYNEANGIVPQSIIKPIDMNLVAIAEGDYVTVPLEAEEEDAGSGSARTDGSIPGGTRRENARGGPQIRFQTGGRISRSHQGAEEQGCHWYYSRLDDDMKSRKPAGLVGAGGVNQSFLARMPALLEQLGPVKGSSLKVSRRIANGLRAGFGVADYRRARALRSHLDLRAGKPAGWCRGATGIRGPAGGQDGGAVRCAARQPPAQSAAHARARAWPP